MATSRFVSLGTSCSVAAALQAGSGWESKIIPYHPDGRPFQLLVVNLSCVLLVDLYVCLLKRKVYAHCFSAFCWLNRYTPPQLFLMFSNLFAVLKMVPFPPVSFLASCLFPHLSTVRSSLVSIDQHITKLANMP